MDFQQNELNRLANERATQFWECKSAGKTPANSSVLS